MSIDSTKTKRSNPFAITKAVDFTDQEIVDYWVDFDEQNNSDGHGFFRMIDPVEKMPKIILGGKGSGKTHVLRYFSYSVQKIRHNAQNLYEGILGEGYLGIYLRCSGLNSNRFSNKGISSDVWRALFDYYFELGIAQIFLENISEVLELDSKDNRRITANDEFIILTEIKKLFDQEIETQLSTIEDLLQFISKEKKQIDSVVNNSIFTGNANHEILITPGKLVYGLPKIFAPLFSDKAPDFMFLYIVDEFENLEDWQQKLVNTLYRDKEGPCSFRIGVRLDGIKTMKTYSAEEENKPGAEYDPVVLDDKFRAGEYREFAQNLILRRLEKYGYNFSSNNSDDKKRLEDVFGASVFSSLTNEEIVFIQKKYKGKKRPWILHLEEMLQEGVSRGVIEVSDKDISAILKNLEYEKDFYVEKHMCFDFFKAWSKKKNLLKSSQQIRETLDGTPSTYQNSHFKSDMFAQIRHDCEIKQAYTGFETFTIMTSGLPRLLLVLIKNIFDWAVFRGEKPFEGNSISLDAQKDGVRDAVEWFFNYAIPLDENGNRMQQSINRLGGLFRAIRFSDKPSECSLAAFSVGGSVEIETAEILKAATASSLLIKGPPRRGKQYSSIEELYQINPMISPRWDLPIARRGTIKIDGKSVDIIFGHPSKTEAEFKQYLANNVEKMNAPLFGKKTNRDQSQKSHKRKKQTNQDTPLLFDKEQND